MLFIVYIIKNYNINNINTYIIHTNYIQINITNNNKTYKKYFENVL